MEDFALYLFKSSVWLTGFAAVYFLFLRNERFFVLNRIFLVAGILSSIAFPFFTWHYTVIFPVMPTVNVDEPQIQFIGAVKESFQAKDLLLYIYILGALYLVYRLIKQTISVWQVIRKSETLHFNSVKLIRTDRYPASFSFFSFVFVNPSTHEHEINEIVNHEQEHIRQRHWIDLLLFEILCTIQWFNPMVWIYGRFIRQNHEFLADEYAIRRSSNPAIYRAALLNQMFGVPVISLANSFNYSINKKRFNMMKQITYSPFRKLKLLLVLPLIAGVFYAFAAPEYKFVQQEGNNEVSNLPQNLKTVKGKVIKEDGSPLQGTSIVVSGSTIGTMPDENGNFKLEVSYDSPIVFSFVGFESVKVKPDFDKEMVITMKRITIGIDLGDDKKTETSLTGFSLDKYEGDALLLVDGKEMSKSEMEKINQDKIESVTVLKKESATILYGEKGKNGVVLITLKKDQSVITPDQQNSEDEMVMYLEEMPEFPGGVSALRQFIESAVKYPEPDQTNGIQGKVFVNFVVSKDGEVTKAKVAKGIDTQLDNEALRVVNSMPKWKPGKQRGQNVAVSYTVPVTFKIPSESGVQIRSTGTAGNPLIVVDGVISSQKVDDIDPETIQSINVLKGEVATKKYSEKGKNGVLEITLKKAKEVFVVVEEMPEFPGGLAALKEYVRVNLQYPKIALENGIRGQVTVGFVVSKTGSIEDVKVIGNSDPSLNQEAARIIRSMPKWKPGVQRGQNVDVSYEIPINFELPSGYQPKNGLKLGKMKNQ